MTTMVSERIDARDMPWPSRPWIMAVVGMIAGWLFWKTATLSDSGAVGDTIDRTWAVTATFIAVATMSFLMTVEIRRWQWALGFALFWGAVIGFVGWASLGYNREHELVSWSFLASIFAVMLAAPLFQSARDEGGWRFPPMVVQMHAWTDAVIGATGMLFVGISFALFALIAGLFNLIGIEFFSDLLSEGWFDLMLAGFAFGAAVGILRERDALVGTMQRLVRIILSVLAPVLAFALVLFLISLPLTGLAGLWDGWVSAAALTLVAAAGCFILLNAAIGPKDGEDGEGGSAKPVSRILLWSAMILALVVLPLALLADTALWLRIAQYGWTPERIWGLLCALIATAYGLAGWWAVIRQRLNFSPLLRLLETRLAIGVTVLALILALPIIDFGAISARDQMARLQSGAVKAADFDWAAMAFDFGPAGRAALQQLSRSGPADQRTLADEALKADNRYAVANPPAGAADSETLRNAMIVRPAGRAVPEAAVREIARMEKCGSGKCVVQWIDDKRFVLLSRSEPRDNPQVLMFSLDANGETWSTDYLNSGISTLTGDLEQVEIESRPVTRQQVYVNGQPVGEVFE
jgi:hypothetical protein